MLWSLAVPFWFKLLEPTPRSCPLLRRAIMEHRRRVGCHCSQTYKDCTYHYVLRTCSECGHRCCDNHSYWTSVDAEGKVQSVRCECCIQKERARDKRLEEIHQILQGMAPDAGRRPRSRSRRGRRGGGGAGSSSA